MYTPTSEEHYALAEYLHEREDEMSKRCINCGGYEHPEIFSGQTEIDMSCTCEEDFAPPWKQTKEDEGAYWYKNSSGEIVSVPK